jgi:hypothetical protein
MVRDCVAILFDVDCLVAESRNSSGWSVTLESDWLRDVSVSIVNTWLVWRAIIFLKTVSVRKVKG